MKKEELVKIWEDTENLCDGEFTEMTDAAREAQTIYIDDIVLSKTPAVQFKTVIKVTGSDTISAAYQAASQGNHVALLNFASATNPGGGTMRGSSAQEECICRCTNLLPCLYDSEDAFNKFYQYHRDLHDNRATKRCIYTPNVVIFKDSSYNRVAPKLVDVITCAAPNLRAYPRNIYNNDACSEALILSNEELYNIHLSRASQILKSAVVNNCDAIILGAFGCGAFRNDPEVVARAWNVAVQQYKKHFRYVEFAVFCKDDITNFDTFRKIIQEE